MDEKNEMRRNKNENKRKKNETSKIKVFVTSCSSDHPVKVENSCPTKAISPDLLHIQVGVPISHSILENSY